MTLSAGSSMATVLQKIQDMVKFEAWDVPSIPNIQNVKK